MMSKNLKGGQDPQTKDNPDATADTDQRNLRFVGNCLAHKGKTPREMCKYGLRYTPYRNTVMTQVFLPIRGGPVMYKGKTDDDGALLGVTKAPHVCEDRLLFTSQHPIGWTTKPLIRQHADDPDDHYRYSEFVEAVDDDLLEFYMESDQRSEQDLAQHLAELQDPDAELTTPIGLFQDPHFSREDEIERDAYLRSELDERLFIDSQKFCE